MHRPWLAALILAVLAGCGGTKTIIIVGSQSPTTGAAGVPTSPTIEQLSAISACNADAKSVETAIEAYKAERGGSYPPTLLTQASAGAGSWSPLISGPLRFLRRAPSSQHYTIWFTHQGAVMIGPPGAASASGSKNFDSNASACADEAN